MDILSKFLTVVLFLNCLFLILLVLVQLPKKEAGLGTAFGGGTTDALFGAGAGNVLTKLTKWNAVLFLVLCLFLSLPFMRPDDLSDQLGQGGVPTTNTNAPAQPAPTPIQQAPSPTPSAPVTPTEEPFDTTTNTPSVTPEAPAEDNEGE
jgi:preprotein translocase subunit SecG